MTEGDFVNQIIIKLRLSPVQARITAHILLTGVPTYEELAKVTRRGNANTIKVHAWRLNRTRAFKQLKIVVSNAFGHGYYFDEPTRAKLFKELGYADPTMGKSRFEPSEKPRIAAQ